MIKIDLNNINKIYANNSAEKTVENINIDFRGKSKVGEKKDTFQYSELSKLEQDAKKLFIASLDEDNLQYTENKDKSISFISDSKSKINVSWKNNVETTYMEFANGNNLIYDIELPEEKGNIKTTIIDNSSGLKHVVNLKDGKTETINYKKNEKGEFVQTDDFMISSFADNIPSGKIFTGSEMSKKMWDIRNKNYRTAEFDEIKNFFNSSTVGCKYELYNKDGGTLSFMLNDGSEVNLWADNYTQIYTPNNKNEYYYPNGERFYENK